MNWNGDTNLYCYDDNEKCFQRYIAEDDVNTQIEAANKAYNNVKNKYNTLVSKYNMLLKIACGLVIVQVIPFVFNGVFGANVSFGGTSLIIIIGVVLETLKQIESQMLVRNYTGFLNVKGKSMKNSFLGY